MLWIRSTEIMDLQNKLRYRKHDEINKLNNIV